MEHSSFGRVSAAVVAATVMMGCVASEVRHGADLLAAFTHQVSEEGAEFVQSRTMLAKARRANIAMLEVNTVELEDSVSRDLAVWRLSGQEGKRRVELFEGVRAYAHSTAWRSTELANLRKRHEASINAAKSAIDLRQAELTKVSKGLASLARDPDLRSELKFFAVYFKEVNAGIENAKEDAKERTKAAEKAAGKAAINVGSQNDGIK